MSEITKKLSAVVLTLALALSFSIGVAAEPTVDDLQDQIAELQELIATLQAQLKGGSQVTTPGTVPAVCAGVSFNRNLSLGASGSDVKCLQALLNTDATTQVAASGAGSKGAETEYFGTLTRTAVIAFQNKYASEVLTPLGLTAGTGIVGVQTRVKLNAMLTAGVPGETTPGETPGTSTPSETGVEGDLRIKVLPTPNNVDVYGGESNVAVMAFEVEAKDSDLTIQRVDIELNQVRAWRFINNIALYDGSNAVKGVDVDRDTVTESAGVSRVRLSGLNIKVTKDSKKTLTVKVGTDARPAADGAVVMTVPEGGVRAVDSAGINQTDGNISRTFNVKSDAEAAKVEFKLNTNSPKEGIALIDENSSTEIELLKADLVVTKGDVDVEKLVFDLTGDRTDVQAVKLYDGTTVIGNVEATEAAVVFSDLDLNIKSGTTKTLTLKAEIAANTATSVTTVSLSAKIEGNKDKTYIIGVNDKDASVGGVASGDTIYFYLVAPEISDIKASITEGKRDDGTTAFADARIEFVLTAKGGNVVLKKATDSITSGDGIVIDSDATISAISVTVGGDDLSAAARTITNGQSKTVVVEGRLAAVDSGSDPGDLTNVRANLKVTEINWTGGYTGAILKDLKTNSVVLTAITPTP
jgi:hypothetical protein